MITDRPGFKDSGYRSFPVVSNPGPTENRHDRPRPVTGRPARVLWDDDPTWRSPLRSRSRSKSRIQLSRAAPAGHAGQPGPRGGDADPQRDQFRPARRHGTAVWLILSSRAAERSTPRSRWIPCSTARATTGMCGLTACPMSSATAIGLTDQGQWPPLRSADDPARPVRAGALLRSTLGELGQPPAAESHDRIDGRARSHRQSAYARWKTRSSTSSTSADIPSTRARASVIPARILGLVDKIRVPQGPRDHGGRIAPRSTSSTRRTVRSSIR